jgi:hypothetical protein
MRATTADSARTYRSSSLGWRTSVYAAGAMRSGVTTSWMRGGRSQRKPWRPRIMARATSTFPASVGRSRAAAEGLREDLDPTIDDLPSIHGAAGSGRRKWTTNGARSTASDEDIRSFARIHLPVAPPRRATS